MAQLDEMAAKNVEACFTPSSQTFFVRYSVGPVLGRGSFSEVRACRCRRTGRELAAKVSGQERTLQKTGCVTFALPRGAGS